MWSQDLSEIAAFGLYLKNDQGEISDRLIYDMPIFWLENFSVLPTGVQKGSNDQKSTIMDIQMRNPGGLEA